MRTLCASVLLAAATLFAQSPKGCVTTELSVGSPATGSLSASDCKLTDVVPTGNGAAVKVYRLSVSERQTLVLEMTSTAFDTYLVLIPGERDGIYGVNDDSPDIGTNSRIVANVAPGSYRVLASASQPGGAGEFQLKVTPEPARKCGVKELPLGETTEGALAASSCRELDISALQASVNPSAVNLYEVNVPEPGILTLEIKGGLRPPEVRIEGGKLPVEPFRSRSRVAVNLPAGTYRVAVSSNLYLSYTLKARFETPRPCQTVALPAGSKLGGVLAEDDCRFQDLLEFGGDPSYIDTYRVELAERGLLRLRMNSGAVDAFLVLADNRGRLLAVNDDVSDDDTSAEILIHLPPGAYTLMASSALIETGDYEIQSTFEPARGCTSRDLSAQGTAETTLGPGGPCRVVDAMLFGQSARGAVSYKLDSKGGLTKVKLTTLGEASFDLIDSSGKLLVHADTDRFGDAATEIRLRAGQYRVLLYSRGDDPQPATLSVSTAAAKSCAVGEFGLNSPLSSKLIAADCRILDAMLESPATTVSKSFRLVVPSAGRVDLDVFSGEFEPVLLLLDQNDTVLESAARRSPAAFRLSANVPAGTYRVIVSSQSSTGSFDLTASFQEGSTAPVSNPRNEPFPKPSSKRGAEPESAPLP